MSGGLGVQAEVWTCCAQGHTITSAGAMSSGQEGPGLAVGVPSLMLPQSLAMGTKGLTRVQPLELQVVKAWLLGGARAELSCIPAVSLPRLVDLDWRIGHQNLLRQHQPHGRPHLFAPDEGMSTIMLTRRQGAEHAGSVSHRPAEMPVSQNHGISVCV